MLSLEEVTAHIRACLKDNPTPADIAAHFGYSRFYLSRWFHFQTGISMRDYIAALKIEQGIEPLVEGKSIIESQLEAGHTSAGTYSRRFHLHTGQTPRDYRNQAAAVSRIFNEQVSDHTSRALPHYSFEPEKHLQPHPLNISISGSNPHSVVFAGLFPEPIPRGVPIVGNALFHTRSFSIRNVPNGIYYLLGCEIEPSLNPLHYFRLDHCLRGIHPEPICFPLAAPLKVSLNMRPFQSSDPPITVNLPKLLFEFIKAQRNP